MSREMIDAIIDDNNLDAENAFKNSITSKVGDALEIKRREISKYFVGNQVEVEEE